jgi:hypothetical protein
MSSATRRTLLTTASDWNNHGVDCINYGDLNGALSLLRRALVVVTVDAPNNLQEAETTTRTTSTNSTFHDSYTTRSLSLPPLQSADRCKNEEYEDQDSRPATKRIKTDTMEKMASSFWHSTCPNAPADQESVSSSSDGDEDEDEGALFPQGIIMAPSPSDEFSISSKLTRFSSIQNQSISSAIITFNIGLVYHLMGRRGFGSLIHLQTAVSMYQDCHDLLSSSCAFCSTGNSTLDLLAMALFYNMAHIHHNDLMDFPLVRFTTCIVTSRYDNHDQVMLIKHAMGDFLCSVMMILYATPVAAAA